MSLDDYASKNKRKGGGGGPSRGQRSTRRPARGGGGPIFERTARNLRQTGRRKAPYNKASRADGRWTNDKFAEIQQEEESFSIVPQQQPVSAATAVPRTVAGDLRNTLKAQAAKLFVSNVEKQITEEELLQLFVGIGTVKSIALHFDKDGKSQGTALVHYASKASADQAVTEFSGRMLDGEELLIEFVNSEVAAPAETSVTIDPLQSIESAPVRMDNSVNYGSYDYDEEDDTTSFWGTAAGSNRSGSRNDYQTSQRGRRQERKGNNRRNRENRENRKNVSADDLDAQMEAYRSKAKKSE